MHKLRIMTIILMAAMLASCSSSQQDDPITPEPKPDPNPQPELMGITFGGNNDTWQDAPTTRAGKTGLETIFPSFRVWGYKTTDDNQTSSQLVMDGYNVRYTQGSSGASQSNTDDWEYVGIPNPSLTQTIKYWDYSASSYRFFAYTPEDANINVSTQDAGTANATTSFQIPFAYSDNTTAKNIPYMSELWYSTNDATLNPYGKCVTLAFAPIIAKVRFKFTYPDGTTAITIRDITFQDSRFIDDPSTADTPLSGDITVSYPLAGTVSSATPNFAWTNADPTTDNAKGSLVFTIPYEEKDDAIHILNDPALYGKWYYVPPLGNSDYAQGPYTVNAIIDGKNSSATVPAAYMQWKAGYQYTYIFKITEAGTLISFSDLQVEEWLPGANIDNNGTGTEGW